VELENSAEPVGESGRIFMRNLAYSTNEEEVTELLGTVSLFISFTAQRFLSQSQSHSSNMTGA